MRFHPLRAAEPGHGWQECDGEQEHDDHEGTGGGNDADELT
ncbi:hypothetical protein [Rathayibacter toxicus]|nr:hypothetical protein [Rathayibacter toxicus]